MEAMAAVFMALVAGVSLAALALVTFKPLPSPPKGVERAWPWPGLPPDITPGRVMCNTCVYHSAAPAGWKHDRCHHPVADLGSVVRNDQLARCWEIRLSTNQCGPTGAWHTPKEGK